MQWKFLQGNLYQGQGHQGDCAIKTTWVDQGLVVFMCWPIKWMVAHVNIGCQAGRLVKVGDQSAVIATSAVDKKEANMDQRQAHQEKEEVVVLSAPDGQARLIHKVPPEQEGG
eukprot:4446995-Ditylum_brightwellii.AAC.2